MCGRKYYSQCSYSNSGGYEMSIINDVDDLIAVMALGGFFCLMGIIVVVSVLK